MPILQAAPAASLLSTPLADALATSGTIATAALSFACLVHAILTLVKELPASLALYRKARERFELEFLEASGAPGSSVRRGTLSSLRAAVYRLIRDVVSVVAFVAATVLCVSTVIGVPAFDLLPAIAVVVLVTEVLLERLWDDSVALLPTTMRLVARTFVGSRIRALQRVRAR